MEQFKTMVKDAGTAQETRYLLAESGGLAFFVYQEGTLFSGQGVCKALFEEFKPQAQDGYLIVTPKVSDEIEPLWEVERVNSDGDSVPNAEPLGVLLERHSLCLP